jgi:hypothetical protein
VVFTEGVLGFEVEGVLVSDTLAGEDFFDLGEQVVATEIELDGIAKIIDQLAVGVFESPGQADDTRG